MKTTKEHFKAFEKEARRMIDMLGMKDWQISFKCCELKDIASVSYSTVGRWAKFELADDIDEDNIYIFEPERYARHEVYHLLLADICDKLHVLNVDKNEITFWQHIIIRRLEKLCVHGVTE